MAKVTEIRDGNGVRASPGFRQRPHNIEVEQRLLGILMVNNDALSRVRDRLRSEHFYEPGHAALYEQTRQRIINGRLADVSSLSAGMDETGRDAMYRLAQSSEVIPPEEIEQCTDELITLWQRRKAIEVAENLVNASYDLEVPADEWRLKAIEELQHVESEGPKPLPKVPPPHVDLSQLSNPLPVRRFIVDQWIPVGHVSSIYGEGSAGKSFLSMILGTCVAAGISWLGNALNVQSCPVLGFFCEDNDDELLIRENQILKGLACRWQDIITKLFLVGRVGSNNAMMTFEHGYPVEGPAMHDLLLKIEQVRPRLIILDNIGHLYGGNENDRFQVTCFLNRLSGIAREIDGAVVILGHPPKSEAQYSGSTAWSNNVRSRCWLEKCTDDEDRWILKRAKSNYAEPCTLDLVRDPVTGIVRPDDPAYESEASRHQMEAKLGTAKSHILKTLDELNARDCFTSQSVSKNYLPKVMEDQELTGGFKRRVLERALKSLLKDGTVVTDVVGQYANRTPRKGLVRTRSLA